MATVLFVQLAIAFVGCCVLAIAALPALLRVGRRSTRPPAVHNVADITATLRESGLHLAARGRELAHVGLDAAFRGAKTTRRAGAQAGVDGARAAGAAMRSGQATAVMLGWALRRRSELIDAAVNERAAMARRSLVAAREKRRAARAEQAAQRAAEQAARQAQLQAAPSPAQHQPPVADSGSGEHVVDLRDKRPSSARAGPRHRA